MSTDMENYLRMCGSLADPDNFEVAELLMTTGLTDGSKDKHMLILVPRPDALAQREVDVGRY